jgi:hypothetical protein
MHCLAPIGTELLSEGQKLPEQDFLPSFGILGSKTALLASLRPKPGGNTLSDIARNDSILWSVYERRPGNSRVGVSTPL